MTITPFPADEFVAFIRERFPSAHVDRTSNHLGTVWITVRTDTGHAEIVATADGTIGATDIVRVDLEEETKNPFAPFDEKLNSVQAARDFMIRALS